MTLCRFQTGAVTDRGCVRPQNEDNYLASPEAGVWLVADGMGGHEAGDFASRRIVEAVGALGTPTSAHDLRRRFRDRVAEAHDAILAQAATIQGGTIGTTLAAVLAHAGNFACVWSGDSRVYLKRGGALRRVTVDHTEVQDLLAAGVLSPDEAETWPRRNLVTRAIGVGEAPRLDEVFGKLRPGDVFLLCSDGLTDHLRDREIAAAMEAGSAQDIAQRLVDLTLQRGARDNVTAVVVRCLAPAEEPARATTVESRHGD